MANDITKAISANPLKNGTYGSVAFAYEKGINGSSILGIV